MAPPPGSSFASLFAAPFEHVVLPLERQGESIAYTGDGKALVTTSEQIPAPLWRLRGAVAGRASVDSAARASPRSPDLLLSLRRARCSPSRRSPSAKEPPNQNDPCSSGGRNTCGTLGVGFYDTYKYGLRWFGDYRGAGPDVAHTFCIDLQYWYPSPKYHFRESTADTLKNRDGAAVSLENRRKMAYAIWAWGRSGKANQQAAVMLYVHGLMGDARPGEVDPDGVERRRRRRLRPGRAGRGALPRARIASS